MNRKLVAVLLGVIFIVSISEEVFARRGSSGRKFFSDTASPEEILKEVALRTLIPSDKKPGTEEGYDIAEDSEAKPVLLLNKVVFLKDKLTEEEKRFELFGGYLSLKTRKEGAKPTADVEMATSFVVFLVPSYNYTNSGFCRSYVRIVWRSFVREGESYSSHKMERAKKHVMGFGLSPDGEVISP